jgi:hypothetical protein
MNSIFDTATRSDLVNRVNALTNEHKAKWGKMNAYQMVKHCKLCDDMFYGDLKIKRVFIGRLIGPMFLKKLLKDDRPFGKNSPTSPLIKTVGESGDIEQQKKEWISRLNGYANFNNTSFVHPFFGPMTKEQIGLLAYKHADHHLRQFGA